jgi:hypothetical protein
MAGQAVGGLVCVATCLDITEAHILSGRLDAAGIPAFLFNEQIYQTLWSHRFTFGGVRIMVPASRAQEAEAFVEACRSDARDFREECERCGSTDVARLFSWRVVPGMLIALLAFSLALGYALYRDRRRCRACGHGWRV